MFDSILDSFIVLIPIAVIIVRFILQARRKNEPAPEAPPIPVHFEDDVEAKPRAEIAVKEKLRKNAVLGRPLFPAVSLAESKNAFQEMADRPAPVRRAAPVQAQGDFFLNLGKLSPLKQAVIMAEVLGPPKALL